MKDVHFTHFKIMGYSPNAVYYRKPTFEEVYKMIISEERNNIINESVYRIEWFQDLFIFLKDETLKFFTTNDLMEYFPMKSKPFKILSKNKDKNFYKLYVVNDDLSNKEVVENILIKISADSVNINQDDVELIFKDLNNAAALFTPLETRKDFGILWLHKNKSTLKDFEHEFIHYLEWIHGYYASDFKTDDQYFEDEEIFKELFQLNKDDVDYFLQKEEYQTLLNDFLNDLEKLRLKYFSDFEGLRFARYISYYLLKDQKEGVKSYFDRIKKFEYFDFLNKENSFAFPMVVAYNCMNYKIQNIKNHVFGKFKFN